jgi:hypothetical protein
MSQLWFLLFLSEEGRAVQKGVADDLSSLLDSDFPRPENEIDSQICIRRHIHQLMTQTF